MSNSISIGLVSESLRNLLLNEMSLNPAVPVTVLAPDEPGGEKRINLFLYKVQENAVLKNMDWRADPANPTRLVPPPLSLSLFYLMTAYAKNDPQTGNSIAHAMLGDAMRVFYENAVVPQDYLPNGLKGSGERIKILMNTLDLEELSKIWSTFTQPFRLSVLYEISVVQLDMLSKNEREMAKRVRRVGTPRVDAPYVPPCVDAVSPSSGKPGTIVTFTGSSLAGWKAYVSVSDRSLLDAELLTQDHFQATVPGDLVPGFYELRVDVSHLFRRAFIFEVIA